jgi:hypothetical protein
MNCDKSTIYLRRSSRFCQFNLRVNHFELIYFAFIVEIPGRPSTLMWFSKWRLICLFLTKVEWLITVHEIANEKISITTRDRVNPSLRQSRGMYYNHVVCIPRLSLSLLVRFENRQPQSIVMSILYPELSFLLRYIIVILYRQTKHTHVVFKMEIDMLIPYEGRIDVKVEVITLKVLRSPPWLGWQLWNIWHKWPYLSLPKSVPNARDKLVPLYLDLIHRIFVLYKRYIPVGRSSIIWLFTVFQKCKQFYLH